MTLGDITVEYMGGNISALSRVYVLLWNRGTSPIEAQDFVAPIQFKLNDQILKLEIYEGYGNFCEPRHQNRNIDD
jgi:hypothetical protein